MYKPWCVMIEFVEGCNRLCSFCGLTATRDKPGQDIKYMDREVLDLLCEQLPDIAPTARYEFSMHGEPTLHPNLLDYVRLFREALPEAQFQLTTNGKRMIGHMYRDLDLLFRMGIDIVVMDTYQPERDKLWEEAFGLISDINVMDYYIVDSRKKTVFSPWYNYHRTVNRTLVLLDDLLVRSGEVSTRKIINYAGNNANAPRLTTPLDKTCVNPFRELTICYDGDVNLCCRDWGHEYTCGNVKTSTLSEIWSGERFEAARCVLFARKRLFTPCARCDAPAGGRAGMLPKYGLYNINDAKVIEEVLSEQTSRNGLLQTINNELLEMIYYEYNNV